MKEYTKSEFDIYLNITNTNYNIKTKKTTSDDIYLFELTILVFTTLIVTLELYTFT